MCVPVRTIILASLTATIKQTSKSSGLFPNIYEAFQNRIVADGNRHQCSADMSGDYQAKAA